jgi:hypothetical protein
LMRGVRLGGCASAALRSALPLTPAHPARSKCWGSNSYGQLGLGDTNDRGGGANDMGANLPSVDLGANWKIVEVAASPHHTCARLENGAARALKCWGYNSDGRLGLGDHSGRGDGGGQMGDSLHAVQLGSNRSAVALAIGRHSCALLTDESVKCWGYNYNGQLGLGDTDYRGDEEGEMGDSLPAVPLGALSCGVHPGPCPAGYTGPLGGPCVACEAGEYKATAGTGTCETCPATTESSSGSTKCQCPAGFTDADAGPCTACLAGGYKATAGSMTCAACPAYTSSAAGSNELTDCMCLSGYTAESDGVACSACEAGQYKAMALHVGFDHSCALSLQGGVRCTPSHPAQVTHRLVDVCASACPRL